ncbi:hypothetical protein FRB93_013551 [Tulasnella sp. JGI-2019a]|nr:hypothetical protein FRB93_013551 [Tulasnella sp. JGI-2019a]
MPLSAASKGVNGSNGDGNGYLDDTNAIMKVWVESVHAKVQARNGSRSSEDLSSLKTADADLSITVTSFEHLERRMRRHISLQQQRRNALLAVYGLPVELLVRIFLLSLQHSFCTDGYVKRLQNLACVCTRWAELVKETALLWGVAASNDPSSTVRRALSKSKDAPLDVRYTGEERVKSMLAPFLKSVAQHSHRWRSLDLVLADREVEDSIMQLPTPILNDLRIVHNTGLQSELFIPNEKLHRLRHLCLTGRPILWEPNALSRLESLELRNLGPTGRPTMSHLIAMLEVSQGIVALTLDQLRLDDPDDLAASAENASPLELPKLTDLSLERLPLSAVRVILTRIRIPICHRLRVQCTYKPHIPVLDSHLTTHLTEQIQAILATAGKLKIFLTPDKMEFSASSEETHTWDPTTPNVWVQIALPTRPLPGPIEWLSNVVSTMAQAPTISLIIDSPRWSSDLIPAPAILPYVNLLHIIDNEKEAASWIQRLSERLPSSEDDDGVPPWTLARMTRLVFHSCYPKVGDLVEMLSRRYGGRGGVVTGQQERQPQSSRDPAPLKLLQITGNNGLSRDMIDQLESIVGSETCVWDDNDEGEGLEDEDGDGYPDSNEDWPDDNDNV